MAVSVEDVFGSDVLLWNTVKSSDGGCKYLTPSATLSTTVSPYNVGFTKTVNQARGQKVMKLILYLVSLQTVIT